MTTLDTLAISIPTLLAIFGSILAWLTYRLKKSESSKQHSKEDIEKAKEEAEKEKQNELRLIAIEKDVQYIRLTVEKFDKRIETNEHKMEDHEGRINKLEVECKKNSKRRK